MAKYYSIEVKLTNRGWITVKTEDRQTDALHYVKQHPHEKYPRRIVRVTRTVVFEEK